LLLICFVVISFNQFIACSTSDSVFLFPVCCFVCCVFCSLFQFVSFPCVQYCERCKVHNYKYYIPIYRFCSYYQNGISGLPLSVICIRAPLFVTKWFLLSKDQLIDASHGKRIQLVVEKCAAFLWLNSIYGYIIIRCWCWASGLIWTFWFVVSILM
jgi:hypothetical protein